MLCPHVSSSQMESGTLSPQTHWCSEYKRWQRASASQGRAPASNSSKMTLNKRSPKPTASPLKGHRQIRTGDASRTARCCCAQPCVQPAAPAHSSARAPLRTASCWEGHWGKGVTRIQTNTFTHAHSDKHQNTTEKQGALGTAGMQAYLMWDMENSFHRDRGQTQEGQLRSSQTSIPWRHRQPRATCCS